MTSLLVIMLVLGVIVVPILLYVRTMNFSRRPGSSDGTSPTSDSSAPLALPAPSWFEAGAADPAMRDVATPPSYGPAMSASRASGTGRQADDRELIVTVDPALDIKRIESRMKMNAQQKLGEMVERHPKLAVELVRGWLAAGPSDGSSRRRSSPKR
jgi:flagellar biosynthesis/type III secretory pathway M-ring protein FliF/YscJ